MAAKKTFEQSLKDLEKIVEEIESGELPLETALSKFETGVKLSETCAKKLDEAEQKITVLMKDKDGNYTNRQFMDAGNDEE